MSFFQIRRVSWMDGDYSIHDCWFVSDEIRGGNIFLFAILYNSTSCGRTTIYPQSQRLKQ